MKMELKICAKDVETIKRVLRVLSEDRLVSNCTGCIEGGDFDYSFVGSNDLYSDDKNEPVIKP